ncbi:lysoplasmalogenase [Streptomyces sp. NPDC047980]|uniref:lysoplasmalogenase n=1 Tax=unclassified Streptomyces TaxID=2593676 RepID=UPI00367DAD45
MRLLPPAFAAAVLLDLASLLAGWDTGHLVAKPLLMPLLAAYAVARRGPRTLVAALLFGWAGDVLLMAGADPAFLAGMAAFAAGHCCWLTLFGRGRTSPVLGAGYVLVLAGALVLLWPDLPAGLRLPVAVYSVLLTAMAYRSSAAGAVAGLGGALFLLSDMLIAVGLADRPRLPAADFWIMLTYAAAQYLLTVGVLGRACARDRAYGEPRTDV